MVFGTPGAGWARPCVVPAIGHGSPEGWAKGRE
jgi:hypothetical protein